MSEGASGGEVDFARLWLPAFGMYISKLDELDAGFHCSLTSEKEYAGVFLNPTPALLEKIAARLAPVETQPATYAEWVEVETIEDRRAHASAVRILKADGA